MLRSPAVAALLASGGLDWICLDAQHGEHDDASVREVCAALAGRTRVLVRPPVGDAAWIGRALDAGAAGVVVPVVESAEQAAAVVAACHYPPRGRRSWGPMGGLHGAAVPDPQHAAVTCSVMVETAAGLAALEAIAATPGVDEVFVGPFDLALALGTTVDELVADPAPDAPLRRVVDACRRHGRVAAAFGATAERTRALLALGFTSVAVTTDAAALADGVSAAAAAVRPS